MLTEEEKKILFKLTRNVINNKEDPIHYDELTDNLLERAATFLSIYKNNELITSIGSLKPENEIFQDVMDNTLTLLSTIKKYDNTKLEISILKNIRKQHFETEKELFGNLIPFKHGVIIEKNKRAATLLPLVWNQIKGKEEFLSQICLKMNLEKGSWKKNAEIFFFETETFVEE